MAKTMTIPGLKKGGQPMPGPPPILNITPELYLQARESVPCVSARSETCPRSDRFRELLSMNARKKKFEKIIGWSAFLASYLLILGLVAAPFANWGTNEKPQLLKEEIASLVAE